MGTLLAVHVRGTHSAALETRLAGYGVVFTEPGSDFSSVQLSPISNGPTEAELADLAALSAERNTDVLWLGFCSVSDAFLFHHWHSGRSVRSLAFGWHEQGVWERVRGGSEPWERTAFFDAQSLAHWSQGAGETEIAELQRIWVAADLREGRSVPSIDARESARAVAEYYRLPGWS